MTMFADFDAIQVGDRRELTRTISEDDVRRFVEMTGDDNPLHVDRAFAETTAFKDVVVHGMLGASFLSTVIGTQLPGPGALWVSQQLEFLHPVRLGDELTVSCSVLRKHERERLLELETLITNQRRETVVSGTGKVKVLAAKPRAAQPATAPRRRVAVVTGGSGGIGRAISARLAKDGFSVVINYFGGKQGAERLVAEITNDGGSAIAVQADVSSSAGTEKLVAEAVRAFGGVDVLVNNASPAIDPRPFDALEWAHVQSQLDVQLRGAFLMVKACLPHMRQAGSGRIVNITSQVIDGSPSVSWTSYAVAKAAVAMLSRYLATELGPMDVTVNCVSPGMTETRLIGNISEKAQLMVARQTPLRRLAQPDDVAAAVAYLVSRDGAFVTGHTLRVNGGITVT